MNIRPLLAVAAGAQLGERPVWDRVRGELVWVDVLAGVLHHQVPGESGASVPLNASVGAVGLRASGGYVAATGGEFRLLDEDGVQEGAAIRPAGVAPGQRFNDGAVDGAGRFWAGTIAHHGTSGALFCLDPDGSVRRVLEGVAESNGLGWSPDSSIMYYVDSGTPDVVAYEFDIFRGRLGAKRIFASVPAASGTPDGLAVDSAGNVWVALWGGSTVRCYEPSGRIADVIRLPVSRVTCPGFGGVDLTDLYITTAWEGSTVAERASEPDAGGVFCVRTAVAGMPAGLFLG